MICAMSRAYCRLFGNERLYLIKRQISLINFKMLERSAKTKNRDGEFWENICQKESNKEITIRRKSSAFGAIKSNKSTSPATSTCSKVQLPGRFFVNSSMKRHDAKRHDENKISSIFS